MKISIVIYGTRGDVQPMLALATALIKRGHEIVFCATPDHESLVKRYHCPFVPFGPDLRKLFQEANVKGGAVVRPSLKAMKEGTAKQIDQLPEIMRGSDLVLGVGFVLGVHSAADRLNVPYRLVVLYLSLIHI
jgi:UDP:flavonoid glycosyltransferase YjiC (YdhE family)